MVAECVCHFIFAERFHVHSFRQSQFGRRFTIGIPVFQGSAAAYPIEARLKYRQQSDKLVFWFELIRPDRVFKQAVTDEIERIHEATGFMLLYGNAGL